MKTSETGIELIKKYEGCSLKAYKCPAGVWTIGYGHTGNVEGKPIRAGMTITPLMAKTLLKIDLQIYESAVNTFVLPVCEINQNQFDALVSFVYNVGINAFAKSTMLKMLKARSIPLAAGQFDRWNKAGGRVLPGLIKRRAEEKALFLKN